MEFMRGSVPARRVPHDAATLCAAVRASVRPAWLGFTTRRTGKGQYEGEPEPGGGESMQQLTSLDAQFLAIETPRTYGHVGGLAVYDPKTAPGGDLTHEDICRLVGERLHLLPPFTSDLEMLGRGLLGLPRQPLRMIRSIPTVLPNLTDFPGVGSIPGAPTAARAVQRAWGLLPGAR